MDYFSAVSKKEKKRIENFRLIWFMTQFMNLERPFSWIRRIAFAVATCLVSLVVALFVKVSLFFSICYSWIKLAE